MFDETAMSQFVKAAQDRVVGELQRAFDEVYAVNHGQPVENVKLALQARVTQIEGMNTLEDPQLTEWAAAISAGVRINATAA